MIGIVPESYVDYVLNGWTRCENSDLVSEIEIEPLDIIEKRAIERALKISGGNITNTANLLKVTRNTIYNKMNKYDLVE